MYQKLTIIGNLGGDPVMKFVPNGDAVTTFSVAASNKYTTKDGSKVEETIWFRVTTWRKLAENCNQYLSKGSRVFIEGRLTPDKETGSPRVYEASDGTHRASFEVLALEVKFLSSKGDVAAKPQQAQAQEAQEEQIPF